MIKKEALEDAKKLVKLVSELKCDKVISMVYGVLSDIYSIDELSDSKSNRKIGFNTEDEEIDCVSGDCVNCYD